MDEVNEPKRILTNIDEVGKRNFKAWFNLCTIGQKTPEKLDPLDLAVLNMVQQKAFIHETFRGAGISFSVFMIYRASSFKFTPVLSTLCSLYLLIPFIAYINERKYENQLLKNILIFKYSELIYHDFPQTRAYFKP